MLVRVSADLDGREVDRAAFHGASVITKRHAVAGARVVGGGGDELGDLLAGAAAVEEGLGHQPAGAAEVAEVAHHLGDRAAQGLAREGLPERVHARVVELERELEVEGRAALLRVERVGAEQELAERELPGPDVGPRRRDEARTLRRDAGHAHDAGRGPRGGGDEAPREGRGGAGA